MVKLPDRAIDSHHRQQGKREHSKAVSLPKKARLISTPLAAELSNRINSQYSTIIQFFDPSFNSQQSTVNNNSDATGIDMTSSLNIYRLNPLNPVDGSLPFFLLLSTSQLPITKLKNDSPTFNPLDSSLV